jgi:hypothetical protein
MPTLISQSSTAISIEWMAPSDNFDAILDYNVYWDLGIEAAFEILTDSTSNLLIWTKDNSEIPELVPGEYYQF